MDVANAIDLNTEILPFGSDTSLGEQIQKAFPQARVVKSLNTMNVSMMFGLALGTPAFNIVVVKK